MSTIRDELISKGLIKSSNTLRKRHKESANKIPHKGTEGGQRQKRNTNTLVSPVLCPICKYKLESSKLREHLSKKHYLDHIPIGPEIQRVITEEWGKRRALVLEIKSLISRIRDGDGSAIPRLMEYTKNKATQNIILSLIGPSESPQGKLFQIHWPTSGHAVQGGAPGSGKKA